MEDQKEAYERGVVAGEIAARLAGHDKHFAAINGSLEHVAEELTQVKLAMQRLGDQAVARDATTLATAAALKEASERSWSLPARLIAVVSVLVALAGVALTYYVATRH